jgi:hypothetical protein
MFDWLLLHTDTSVGYQFVLALLCIYFITCRSIARSFHFLLILHRLSVRCSLYANKVCLVAIATLVFHMNCLWDSSSLKLLQLFIMFNVPLFRNNATCRGCCGKGRVSHANSKKI